MVQSGFNRVQVRLLALRAPELLIAGLQPNIQIDLSIKNDGTKVRMSADKGGFRFQLSAESVMVDSISAYRESSN